MKIALCTELRNVEWFESRLRSLFDGDGQLTSALNYVTSTKEYKAYYLSLIHI